MYDGLVVEFVQGGQSVFSSTFLEGGQLRVCIVTSTLAILTHDDAKPNCCSKWNDKLNKEINWSITYKKIKKIRDIKLKWFQIRLVNRMLATNIALCYMGVERESTCTFCNKE